MDINALYPTRTTFTQGTSGEYTAEMTSTWGSTYEDVAVNDISSYWLGYISKNNLPEQYKRGIIYYDEEAGKVVIKDIVDKSNFPCTYGSFESYGSVQQRYLLAQTVDGTETISSNGYVRLYNQLYPEYIGLSYNANNNYNYALHIELDYVLFDAGNNIINSEYSNGYKLTSTIGILFNNTKYGRNAVKAAYDFLFKNADYVLTISSHNFIITAADLASGTCYLTSDDGYSVRLFLTGYEINMYAVISSSNTYKPMGFIVKTKQTHLDHVYEDTCISNGADGSTAWWHRSGSTAGNAIDQHKSEDDPIYAYYWGFDEEIDINDILRVDGFNSASTGYAYGYTEHVFLHRDNQSGYGARCILTPYFPISSVEKTFSLSIRVDVSGTFTPSYSEYFTYATDVTANNEFLAKLKTGDITNATFKNGLREWQYENIQTDDFDETDIPPYVPPEPPEPPRPDPEDPGEDETDGDDAKPNDPSGLGGGFRFTTQYALSATHLQELGAKLWQGFGNINNYINNFTFNVDSDTGSVNFADIMQFFISLRAYPCPISAMASTSAGGTDMRIGSGATPIELNTNFSIVNSYIGQINAGSVTIPFWYGDYRDYSLEIIAYLPYCGTVELNPGDVMGGTLNAFYTVDLCTGACMGYLICTTWEGKTIWVGALPGQLGADVPLTATNAGQVAARMYGDRINFADTVLGVVKSTATGIGAAMSGNLGGFAGQMINATIGSSLELERQNAGIGARGAIAAPMLSGGRGFASFGTSKTAYVQIRSPFYAAPTNYASTVGNPSTSAVRIGDCTGFARFVNVDVSGITTDADDQQAIRRALETGVII